MWECSGLTEEQYNQFRAQFLSLDQNKDGLITVEEVQQVMAGAGLVCRLEEINRMMETCDRNKVRLEKLNIAMHSPSCMQHPTINEKAVFWRQYLWCAPKL